MSKDWLIISGIFIAVFFATATIVCNACAARPNVQKEPVPITQKRWLGPCASCHLEKQPPDPCPGLKGSEWEQCQDKAHRYPDEDIQK